MFICILKAYTCRKIVLINYLTAYLIANCIAVFPGSTYGTHM